MLKFFSGGYTQLTFANIKSILSIPLIKIRKFVHILEWLDSRGGAGSEPQVANAAGSLTR